MPVVWDEVQSAANSDSRIVLLDKASGDELIKRVRRKFVIDASALWWWESLRHESERLPYDDLMAGLELLRARIDGQPLVNLIVTDDEPEPYGVVAGPAEAIVDLLGKTPTFEFALTDPVMRWLILDTHHNSLVGGRRSVSLAVGVSSSGCHSPLPR